MIHDVIPIDVDSIPYFQPVTLSDDSYQFKFMYNTTNDTYYIDLYDYSGNLIIAGEPLMLNQPLWRDINSDDLPIDTIIPMDEAGLETVITGDNLGDTVQLCIDNLGDDS